MTPTLVWNPEATHQIRQSHGAVYLPNRSVRRECVDVLTPTHLPSDRSLRPEAVNLFTQAPLPSDRSLRPETGSSPTQSSPSAARSLPHDGLSSPETGAPLAPSSGPTLLLLGPVQLHGAQGQPPNRATSACLEYLAWLLGHPGASARAMTRDLVVADSTRRGNLCRLRSWLGRTDEGELYLPEAYGGRLQLHPAVGSDWRYFRWLTARGLAVTPTEDLITALRLVRGEPLTDQRLGGQSWPWADAWRVVMCDAIRQVGATVAERALTAGHLDQARWAVNQALSAVGHDETLLRLRLETEQRSGHTSEVDRLIARLHRLTIEIGADLQPRTLDLLREIAHRRLRGTPWLCRVSEVTS